VRRGFPLLIDVLGADHGGYVKRMQAAVTAISGGAAALDVKICQLVHLYDQGQPVKMSKRSGSFVTLRDVVDEVGKDIVRFMMLTRKNDQTLDFDFAKVVEQSRDNTVWYVQYAHARAQSVLRHAAASADSILAADLSRLADPAEIALIRLLAGWPRLIEAAAEAHEPHRLAFFLNDVASAFHALWNKGKDDATLRFILADDPGITMARLALVTSVALVIASGLEVFGVEPVMELR
jgi:arginyl-tRNA synthetase